MTKKKSVKFWAILISVSVFCIALLVAGIVIVNKNRVTVSFDLGLPELVENAEDFEPVKLWKGKKLGVAVPTMELAEFGGWLVRVSEFGYVPYDMEEPVTEDMVLYADWVLDETDATGNGISDTYEAYLEYPEIEIYRDSDGDGADDNWEYENGYDPKSFNEVFQVSERRETIGEGISVQVDIELAGEHAESLYIASVGSQHSPYLSPAIAGYMGSAYEFAVEGEFEAATITFNYDTSIYGRPSDTFQPRIYYVNEETGKMEELPDQVSNRGVVKAKVTHFSKYILLNKVEFDKVWQQDIVSPSVKGIGMDIVFAIDNSASMADNDSANLRYEVVNKFLENMGQFDKAGLLYFERQGHILSQLTQEYADFSAKMNGIVVDSGDNLRTSGTSTIAALRTAASLFAGNEKYKYIVLISDGRDSGTYDENKTAEVINEMVAAGIVVHTIGVGDVDTTRLQQYADGTGGMYFYACTPEDLAKASNGIKEAAEGSEENYEGDANGDGIKDHYAEMIKAGTLTFANGSKELAGVDFSKNADFDGDGLLNGEEIEVVEEEVIDWTSLAGKKKNVYMVKKSDPRAEDTDSDGYSDKFERDNGMDPLTASKPAGQLAEVMSGNNYFHAYKYDEFKSSLTYQTAIGVLALYTGKWDRQDMYQKALLDYMQSWAEYSNFTYQNDPNGNSVGKFLNDTFDAMKSNPQSALGSAVFGKLSDAQMSDLAEFIAEIVNENGLNGYDKTIRFINAGTEQQYIIYIQKHRDITWTKDFSDFMSIYSNTMTALDVMDRLFLIEEIARYYDVFYANIDYLTAIAATTDELEVKLAVNSIKNAMQKDGKATMEAIGREAISIAVNQGISKLYSQNLVTKVTKFILDLGIVAPSGVSKDVEQLHEMILYHEMVSGAISMFNSQMVRSGNEFKLYRGGNLQMANRAIEHLGSTRILAENKYYEFVRDDGWIKGDDPWEKEKIKEIIKNTALVMQIIGHKIPQTQMFEDIYKSFGISF